MKSTTKLILAAVVLAGAALTPQRLQAGGIELYEIASPDVGLASAGYAARAQDASTLFKNPAGMSLLDGTQLQAGAQLTYGSVAFAPDGQTSARLGGDAGGNAIGALPAASLFYVYDLAEKWRVGIGTLSYFGLVENYSDNWVGRYYVQQGALLGMSLLPTVSFKPTDYLSIGAGLNAMYGYFDTKVAVNNVDPGYADGQLSLKDGEWGFGANLGVMVELAKGTRLGVSYLSPVRLNFKDTPNFSNLGPSLSGLLFAAPQLDLGMTVPQSVMVGGYHELNAEWALMADFGWQNWSQFGEVQVGVDRASALSPAQTTTANFNYQDTWHIALGTQYRPCAKWQFTGGVAFDSSAVDNANRTVTLPMGQAWRFGLGAAWQLSEAVNINAAYEFMWAGSMAVDQGSSTSLRGRVAGSYTDSWFSFFTLNLTWRF
jgi:long-chain fatty acid transport protein